MKRKIFAAFLAVAVCLFCVPLFSGCSAEIGYTLKTDDNGEKYYVAALSGSALGLTGTLEIPEYYGEGEDRYPVKEIAEQGFAGTNIYNLIIPATVEKIGIAAFSYCSSLMTVEFAEGIALKEIPWGAFGYCSSLRSIEVPEGVEVVDGMAFYYCEKLSEVTLPEGLLHINMRAFEACIFLTEIILPQTLIRVGIQAFYQSGLESIVLPDSMHDTESVLLDEEGNELVDEDGNTVTEVIPAIGIAAFHSCTSLTLAVVGGGITSVSEGAFGYCTSLEEVYLPAGLKEIKGAKFTDDGDMFCGHAFHHNEALAKVYFAGTEEEWNGVEIDNETRVSNSVSFDNSAIVSAEKIFGTAYTK